LLNTLKRISRHPFVVLTHVPSELNSHSPDAFCNRCVEALSRAIHWPTRSPSSLQIARTVSLLTLSPQNSSSFWADF